MATETGPETVQRVLSSYDLGRKLKQLRMRKKIGLVDLGKHTGLSASMLSQLENGKLIPTLPTLARIAMVFDVGLDHFFADRKRRSLFSVVRAMPIRLTPKGTTCGVSSLGRKVRRTWAPRPAWQFRAPSGMLSSGRIAC